MKKYWIYRNLHTKTWSVKCHGAVIAHPLFLDLENVEFRVWQGTLARIRREGKKSVGAFVIAERIVGDNVKDYESFISDKLTEVTFNPYKYDQFVVKATKKPIYAAVRCIMTPEMRVFVL